MPHEPQSHEDVEAILQIAMSSATNLPAGTTLRDQLLASGRELGLSDEEIARAEVQWRAKKEREALSDFQRGQKWLFAAHGVLYLMVCTTLIVLALYKDVDQDLAGILPFAWGALLWYHFRACLDPTSQVFKRRYESWKAERVEKR